MTPASQVTTNVTGTSAPLVQLQQVMGRIGDHRDALTPSRAGDLDHLRADQVVDPQLVVVRRRKRRGGQGPADVALGRGAIVDPVEVHEPAATHRP